MAPTSPFLANQLSNCCPHACAQNTPVRPSRAAACCLQPVQAHVLAGSQSRHMCLQTS
jgi:hypothetical protein